MKSVLLIGLGRFGRHAAIKLTELGHEVMAIDKDQGRVEAALPIVTNALIGDSTRQDFMASLGVRDFDLCIVGIGDDFQSSLETTSTRREESGRAGFAGCACKISAPERGGRCRLPGEAGGGMGRDKI